MQDIATSMCDFFGINQKDKAERERTRDKIDPAHIDFLSDIKTFLKLSCQQTMSTQVRYQVFFECFGVEC